jgi:spore coat polysaccharide biosynthesis protein SpsF (cytidylyltransferase family)
VKKIAVITQCRLGSKRLPSKLIYKIEDEYIINLFINRLKQINNTEIILALANEKNINELKSKIKYKDIKLYTGSVNNVLKRYYDCAKYYKIDIIIRITSDCPLIDPYLVQQGIKIFKKKRVDYLSNNLQRSWPHGLDYEIFTFKALRYAYHNTINKYNLEHVTPFIRKSKKFRRYSIKNKIKIKYTRWTLDYLDDFNYIKKLHKKFNYLKYDFNWKRLFKDILSANNRF